MKTSFIQKNPHKPPAFLCICLIAMGMLISGCALHPQRMNKEQLWEAAKDDLGDLNHVQEPVDRPITLHEAMARAIKYNREYRVNLMQSSLAMAELELTRFDLLPDLMVNAGYTTRDKRIASASESYETGQESLEPSISQDRDRHFGDISFTWSILDFGLSYVQAQQQADRYLIARQAERKTIHNIVNDVGVAWWKALSAQRLMAQVPPLMTKVEKALKDSRAIETERLDTPTTALKYQRSLLNMLRTLEGLKKELMGAKDELAHLMGLPPGYRFTICDSEGMQSDLTRIAWNVNTMEKIALLSRPELITGHYQQRINQKESKLALLRLLPDLSLDAGWNYDSNSYLVHRSWYDVGGRLAGSLMNLVKMPQTLENTKAGEAVRRMQHLAVSSTILMQVHLAKTAHIQSMRSFELENEIFAVEDRLLMQKINERDMEANGEHALIGQRLNHLLAQFRRNSAFAELQNNFLRLLWTMGIDPVPPTVDTASVKGLADKIRQQMKKWEKAKLTQVKGIDFYLPLPPKIYAPIQTHSLQGGLDKNLRSTLFLTMSMLLLLGFSFFTRTAWAGETGMALEPPTARGLIVAAQQPVISSQISGVIQRIRVSEGDTFKKGELLAAFDDALFQARKEKASAELEAARAKLANLKKLARLESVGSLSVSLAEAEVRSRQAEVRIAQISLNRCRIRAPFNGRLVTRFASEHEAIAPNQKILEIVSSDELEIEILAPSSWLIWLSPGLQFQIIVDDAPERITGAVINVGAVVDPVSKMIQIRGRLKSGHSDLLPGMTTTVRFPSVISHSAPPREAE